MKKPIPKRISSNDERRRRNDRDRRARESTEGQWTLCPNCRNYYAWFSSAGLKGCVCYCSYLFTGKERNPIATRANTGDNIIHQAWRGSDQRTTVYLECDIRMRGIGFEAISYGRGKPVHADSQVTCLLCLSFLEDE